MREGGAARFRPCGLNMRTILHLSDLHFGRVHPDIVSPLVRAIKEVSPDLVAVSGDFTQRARRGQFLAARAFLDALPFRQIVVPGNHDVPLYNVAARMVSPFGGYRKYICADLEPSWIDDEIAVVGMNTARALVARGGGRLSREQVARAVSLLKPLPPQVLRVIVTHHPFDVPEGVSDEHLVGRADMAMVELAGCGADLFLAGHLHLSHIGHTAERYEIEGHSALVVQAGTMSTRGRGESNTFNVIRVQRPDATIERHTWEGRDRFAVTWSGRFHHTPLGWSALA